MPAFLYDLPPELLEQFEAYMSLRDASGVVTESARDHVVELVKALVTENGKLEPSTEKRLGGQPIRGRNEIVRNLIQALVGFEPILPAWIIAVASGHGFKLFKPSTYRERSKEAKKGAEGGNGSGEDGRAIGSVGAFLQRHLAQFRGDFQSGKTSPAMLRAQLAEISILTGTMVFKTLQDMTCARMAIGPAWTVMKAVDTLPTAIQRRIDALAGDEDYRVALAKAVLEVTEKFEPSAERTIEEMKTSLPDGEDAEQYFAEREERLMQAAGDRLVAAIEERMSPDFVPNSMNLNLALAAERAVKAVKDNSIRLNPVEIERRVLRATDYMMNSTSFTDGQHNARLALLMSSLQSQRSDAERIGSLLLTANLVFQTEGLESSFWFTGEGDTDAVILGILKRILSYVLEKGPPPLGVPIEHLPFFDLIYNAVTSFGVDEWKAKEEWRKISAVSDICRGVEATDVEIAAMQSTGLQGLNPRRFEDAMNQRSRDQP